MFNFNRLKEIESKLLENQGKIREIEYENRYIKMSPFIDGDIKNIENHNKVLELERQYILDRRNSWKPKIFWDVLIPIIVTVITTYLISVLIK